MSAKEITLEALADGQGVCAQFFWSGDRFAHRIQLVVDGRQQPWLASLEGSPQDSAPPSPAFQQLARERHGATEVLLLVGMAGGSHWSGSIEADVSRRALVFDIACRTPRPSALGSGYEQLSSCSAGRIEGGGQQMAEGQLRICPEMPERFPATVRWKYVLVADPA